MNHQMGAAALAGELIVLAVKLVAIKTQSQLHFRWMVSRLEDIV
jgi:hypothetical protein